MKIVITLRQLSHNANDAFGQTSGHIAGGDMLNGTARQAIAHERTYQLDLS
jgi:hypothetical protein